MKGARKAFDATVRLRPNNAEARTGLAYTLLLANRSSEAETEARRALELDAQNIDAHYIVAVARMRANAPSDALAEAEAALEIKPDFAPALLLKSQILINIFMKQAFTSTGHTSEDRYRWLKSARESLEKFLQLSPNEPDIALWREQLESLSVYAELNDKSNPARSVFNGSEVTQKLRILSKPEPTYTEAARGAGVQARVVLLAVMAADGEVKHILVLQPSSHGLTEQSIRAARRIKFEPAIKDFRPVSQVVQLEYNFNLY